MNERQWQIFTAWRDTIDQHRFTTKELFERITIAINLLRQGYVL
jgi:hypothetical protein